MTRQTIWITAVLLAGLTCPALAQDVWSTPHPGVRYLDRTTASPAWRVHALEVKLETAGLKVDATPPAHRSKTTSSYANSVGAVGAVNADFYTGASKTPVGLAAGQGQQWTDTADTTTHATVVFRKDGSVTLHPEAEVVTFDPATMEGTVGGTPFVLTGGTVPNHTGDHCTVRHPRTMVGLSQDKKTFFMVAVDGRSTVSVGMTCQEMGQLMKGLGAHDALSLDGGGSTTLFLDGQVRNTPSDGSQRVVANHIGVFLDAGPVGTLKGLIHEGADTNQRIVGATVSVAGGPSMLTDSIGKYEFALAPGTYTATATMEGYAPASVTRTVTSGQAVWGSMGLYPAPDAGTVEEPDAGLEPDAGASPPDAGPGDGADAGSDAQDAGTSGPADPQPAPGASHEEPQGGCASAPGAAAGLGALALLGLIRRRSEASPPKPRC